MVSYFIERFDNTLPQSVFSVLTLLGSYAPQSFVSTRTHAQHLHRLCDFAFAIVDSPYLEAAARRGESELEAVEGDVREKLRVAVLLKTMLCTQASTVMMFLPMWNAVLQRMAQFVKVLHEVRRSENQ